MNSWLGGDSQALAKTKPRRKESWGSRMKTSKSNSWIFCVAAAVTLAVAFSGRLGAQSAAMESFGGASGSGTQWSLQVQRIDPGQADLAYSFQVAIYENL